MATAGIIIAVAGAVAATATGVTAAEQEKNAANRQIDLQQAQQKVAYQQKTLANYDQIQQTIDAQTAAASVRGFNLSSPSFNAIQVSTENKGARAQKNIELENDVQEANVNIERQNVEDTFHQKMFGALIGGSVKTASAINNNPSKPSDKIGSSSANTTSTTPSKRLPGT